MKKQTGIWIDTKKAVIICLEEDNHTLKTIDSLIESNERIPGEGRWFTRFGNQFLNFEKKKRNRRNSEVKKFLTIIKTEIKDSDELVLFGPASMKKELVKIIHEDSQLSPMLKGVKTADSMSDNQLVAWVKNYFANN